MTEFILRDARPSDATRIADFNIAMAQETEARELPEASIRPGVEAVLTDPGRGRYWVAESDDGIVGQIMVTWEWSDWRNGTMWWIQSVYVEPAWRRRGVFTALYRHVESVARTSGDACGLRLYVEKDNTRALATYAALGMRDPGYRVMELDFQSGEQ